MNKTAASNLYQCHWCNAINNSLVADWCLCASAQHTLVCSGCKRCFCQAPEALRKLFWALASKELTSRRWQAMKQLQTKHEQPGQINGPVILVVDDSKVIHTVVETILSDFEGTILHAYDGSEGYFLARSIQPELLLTDALLPGIDGRDMVRLLKSDPSTRHIRAVVMTALYKGLRYRSEAFREFLCDEYIEKPVSAVHLRSVVENMLRTKVPAPQEALAS